jgi:class 3 adenylate cyclase
MHVSGWLMNLTAKSLAESVDVRTMTHIARKFIHNYDLNERTGISWNISIPNQTAAKQIVKDMRDNELLLQMVNYLFELDENGMMGRKITIPHLRQISRELTKAGFIYDEEFKMFVEDPRVKRTVNWGVLRENEEYLFTFLRIDIVANSSLVRKYPDDIIHTTYSDLRSIVENAVERRNGRIWNWEGDGGLIAFYFSHKNTRAALSAMEIVHELFIYNLLRCKIKEHLKIRMAVHSGQCPFNRNYENVSSDTLKELQEIESKYTKPNSVTFSSNVHIMLDQKIAAQLDPVKSGSNSSFYRYELKLEK